MNFENTLTFLGFKLDGTITYYCEESKCDNVTNCVVYIQDSEEYYNHKTKSCEVTWCKRYCCEKCLNSIMDCILCGGYYSNMRIFKNGKDVSDDFDFTYYELDPNKIYNEVDDSESEDEQN